MPAFASKASGQAYFPGEQAEKVALDQMKFPAGLSCVYATVMCKILESVYLAGIKNILKVAAWHLSDELS